MLISTFNAVPESVPAAAFFKSARTVPVAPVPALAIDFDAPIVTPLVKVVALVNVIAPVDTPPIVIVPEPAALIVSGAFVPEVITDTCAPLPAAKPFTFTPSACEPVEESTLKAGLVSPLRPTANACAEEDVIVPNAVNDEPPIVVPAGRRTVEESDISTLL